MKLLLSQLASPIGTILLVTDAEAVRALGFLDHEPRLHRSLRLHYRSYELTPTTGPGEPARQIAAYFEGDVGVLDRIVVRTGGTDFQRLVWTTLRLIPPGTTSSYGQLAARLGKTRASRAVGAANGANPVAIAVPCHRLVGADARLTGYGGGLERKAWLLAHERRYAAADGAAGDNERGRPGARAANDLAGL